MNDPQKKHRLGTVSYLHFHTSSREDTDMRIMLLDS